MPILATGRSIARPPPGRCHGTGGFTLLELIVVIAIIGVLVTVAGLAVPDRSRDRLDRSGERLSATLHACARGAVLSAVPHGVLIGADRYTPVQWRGSWQPSTPPRTLADDIDLLVEGAVPPAAAADEPTVVCLPTGEVHMPVLRLVHRATAGHYEFAVDVDGGIGATWRETAS